jgi:hypothetical protein
MVVSQTQIDQADASIRATWPAYTKYIHSDTFTCYTTFNILAAGTDVLSDIDVDGSVLNSQPVPQSQVWRLDDIYISTSTDITVNALIKFQKNKVKILGNTANIATQLVSNTTRPGLPGVFIYEPNSSLQIFGRNLADVTATATNTFSVAAMVYDSSFG